MNLKKLFLKIKAFRLTKLFGGDEKKRMKKENQSSRNLMKNNHAWMRPPVSHGYRIVEDPIGRTPSIFDHIDSVMVQRGQIYNQQIFFFGLYYSKVVADEVNKYLQTYLFDVKDKEVLARRKKKVMRKAHQKAITTVKEKDKQPINETWKMDVASALVINGEKLITACIGEYRAVICKDGKASSVGNKRHHQQFDKPHCLPKNIPGFLARTKEAMVGHKSNNNKTTTASKEKSSSPEISSNPQMQVVSKRIDPYTEFVILASTGIWEVIEDQEAVNLISHIMDPLEAAECLTNEAITRTSRSSISCLVIRFDH